MHIGFAGLGIMGGPMSLNLVKAGFKIAVWNRTSAKTAPLREVGAAIAGSLKDLAERSEVLITILNDTPDVEEVVLGQHGLQSGLSEGKIIVDMSTICPDATLRIAERLQERNCKMLDAPVSGGDIGARNGTLAIMVGGEKAEFDRLLPVFEAMGKNIVYCGGNSAGQRVKMINQILGSVHTMALAEAFTIAEQNGLDLETVHKVVASGAAGSWALDNYGPRLLRGDTQPGFKLSMQQKDLRIAMSGLAKLKGSFKLTELAFEQYTAAQEAGFGDLGAHGIIEFYRNRGAE